PALLFWLMNNWQPSFYMVTSPYDGRCAELRLGSGQGPYQPRQARRSFERAQQAFFDRRRVIAEDLDHSGTEVRYFCFGWVDGGVMTVRFTWRDGVIRIFGAGYWRKGKRIYEQQNG